MNDLIDIPQTIEHLTNLTSLDLSYNPLQDFSFLPHLNLKSLALGGIQGITEIFDTIHPLTNLEICFSMT